MSEQNDHTVTFTPAPGAWEMLTWVADEAALWTGRAPKQHEMVELLRFVPGTEEGEFIVSEQRAYQAETPAYLLATKADFTRVEERHKDIRSAVERLERAVWDFSEWVALTTDIDAERTGQLERAMNQKRADLYRLLGMGEEVAG